MSPFEETPTKRSRSTFDPSFKLEVVNTIKNQGFSVSQLAKDMNLTESTVRRWVQQVDEELAGRPGKGLPLTPDQQRIRHTWGPTAPTQGRQRDPKKASAFFARALR